MVVDLHRMDPDERGAEIGVGLGLEAGQVAGLSGVPGSGLTRMGLSLLAPHAMVGPLVYVDVRGWANPIAAWELGIAPDRFVVVRTTDVVTWGRVTATLVTGVRGVYAEVPHGTREAVLRRLVAKARTHRTPIVLRSLDGSLPAGIAHLRLEARAVHWEGAGDGHGLLVRRRTVVEASGKAVRGMYRTIEVEDDGTNALRVVPGMGAAQARRLA